jgi:superfamily II DNA or RNA helicase
LILDEGHHSASETATSVFGRIKPKLFLATTATPFRTDRMKLCFSKVIKDAGIRQLIDSGWLSPFHHYSLENDWTPQNVAQLYQADQNRWGKSVMFFLTVAECHRCAAVLRARGVTCEVVHGGSDQEAQIQAFERGEVQVLLNVVVLTEGFDAPDLQTVFIRPGSKGPTIQMAGRVLRKHPGKSFAQIVQNSRTQWPFTKIASAEAKFVQDGQGWQRRDIVPQRVTVAQANTIRAIAQSETRMPKYLARRRPRPLRGGRPSAVL